MEKVKNGRMEVRMKWKYGMALLGFRILDFRICVRSPLRSTTTDLPSDGACAAIYDNPGQKDRSVVQEFSASHSEHFAEKHGP